MNNTDRFIQYLAGDYSDDDWSDVAIEHAIRLAESLTVEDWKTIYLHWRDYRLGAKVRLANVIPEVSSWNSWMGTILVEMLSSEDVALQEASVDAINSVAQSFPDRIPRNAKFKDAIREIKSESPVVSTVLDSLRKKLNV